LAKNNNSIHCGALITSVSLHSPFFIGKRRIPPPSSYTDNDNLNNDDKEVVINVDDEQYRKYDNSNSNNNGLPLGEPNYNHLQPNDQILIINSHRVRNPKLAANMIKSAMSGTLTIVISRGKQIHGMKYCLAKINDVYLLRERKVGDDDEDCPPAPSSSSSSSSWHGLHFRSTHEGRLTRISGIPVDNGNPFINIGLEVGDVILSVDGVVVRSTNDAQRLLEETAIDWPSSKRTSKGSSGLVSLTTSSRNTSRQHSSRVVTLLVYSLWSLRQKVLNEMLSLTENKWQVSYSNEETNVSKEEDEQRKEYIMLRFANTSVPFRLEFDRDGKCSCHEPSYNSPVLESLYTQHVIPVIDALNMHTSSQMRLLADAILASDSDVRMMGKRPGVILPTTPFDNRGVLPTPVSDARMTVKRPGRSTTPLPVIAPQLVELATQMSISNHETGPQVVEQAKQRSISIDYYPIRMKKQSHHLQQQQQQLLNKESLGKSRPETLHPTVPKPSYIDLSARSSKSCTMPSSKNSNPNIEISSRKFDEWLENQTNGSNSQTALNSRQMSSTGLPRKVMNDVNFDPSKNPTTVRPRQIEQIDEGEFELSFAEIKVPQYFDIDDDVSAITGYFEKPTQQRIDKIQRMPSIVPNDLSRSSLYQSRSSVSDSDDDSSTSTTSSVDSSVDSDSIDDDEDEEPQPQYGQVSLRKSSRQNNLVVHKGNKCNAPPLTRRLKMRIADIRECYKVSHRICGAGSFGTVRSCTHRSTRQKFAVKSITKAGNANIITLLKNELALVQRVNHRHVVMVVDVIQDLDYIHIGKLLTFFDVS
jgi:hypothetical protein